MLENDLNNFTGTENWTKHQFGALLFTDGINYLRDKADCFWLVDAIASHQSDKLDELADGFQIWLLKSAPTAARPKRAILTCRLDTDTDPLVEQIIPFCSFPFDQFREPLKLYVGGRGRPQGMSIQNCRILMLPSEN